jgi:hypothetical protein
MNLHNSARNVIIALVALVAASIVSLGCYTIIKHPQIQSTQTSVDTEGYTHTSGDRDCMRCHQDFGQYPYGYYYSDYYPSYYWDYPRWGSYYAYPWWWDHFWYSGGSQQAGDTNSDQRPDRRRQGLAPPYTQGGNLNMPTPPPLPPLFTPGGTSTGSSGTATGGSSGGNNNGNDNGNNSGKKEKKEQKPPKRRGGNKKGDG